MTCLRCNGDGFLEATVRGEMAKRPCACKGGEMSDLPEKVEKAMLRIHIPHPAYHPDTCPSCVELRAAILVGKADEALRNASIPMRKP